MSRSPHHGVSLAGSAVEQTYIFSKNDPYDRTASIQYVVPKLMESKHFMASIREFRPSPNLSRSGSRAEWVHSEG